MTKNLMNKTRPIDNPYEIYKSQNGEWEWRVLKKWQTPSNEKDNEYSRWFCAVKSPNTFGSWEYGDEYVINIKKYGICTFKDPICEGGI